MNVAVRFRSAISAKIELLAEGLALALSASGALTAAIFGKLLLGLLLGCIAVGFVLRLKTRRTTKGQAAATAPTLPAKLTTAVLSFAETAAAVEASNLPVRFDQEGFQFIHWALLAVFFIVAYLLQRPLVSTILSKIRQRNAA
jgi:hypothetical protein